MKKIRKMNLKILCTLLLLPLTFLAGVFLSACADKNYNATFKQEEYSLSVGERKNISEDIELENITLQDLYFNSSDSSVVSVSTSSPLDAESKTEIKALKPGKAIIYIYLRGETLDTVEVTVKKQFGMPTNIRVSESGLIEWDSVALIENGKEIRPSYSIFIATDPKHPENHNIYTTTEPCYQLSARGRYFVSVQALGTDYIDSSEETDIVELYYQSMRTVPNFKFENIDDGENQKARLSWGAVSGAEHYKLTIGETLIVTDTNYEFDLKDYFTESKEESLTVSIIACKEGVNDSPREELVIREVVLNNLQILDGKLSWAKHDKANGYIIHYESLVDPLVRGNISLTECETSLDSLNAGSYKVSVQALGKDSGDRQIYYSNSVANVLSSSLAKLPAPSFDYSISGETVAFTISTDRSEIKNFIVKFVEKQTKQTIEKVVSIKTNAIDGIYSVSDSVELPEVGKYEVTIKSLASGINTINLDGEVCTYIVDSTQSKELTVFKLPAVGTISHTYDADQNSIISFARPSYESTYTNMGYVVKINGHEVEVLEKNLTSIGNYYLNIGKILPEYADPSDPLVYTISVETKIDGLGNGEEYIGDKNTKVLRELEIATMNVQGEELKTNYIYSANNSKEYSYKLYSSNSEFNTKIEEVASLDDNYGVVQKPKAGYYIIEIVAYTNNANVYLNGKITDTFYVKSVLSPAVLDFGKTTTKIENPSDILDTTLFSGYYLEINAVAEATKYNVSLDGSLLGTVSDSDSDGKIYYYFPKAHDFSSGDHTILVEAKGYDDFLFVSAFSAVDVEKLASPTNIVQDDQTLKFTYGGGILQFYKNDTTAENKLSVESMPTANEDEFEYSIDVSQIMTDFDLVIYADKEATENEIYYIPSDQVSYKIHKVTTITDFYFSKDKVYFKYNDTNDYLALAEGETNGKIDLMAMVSLLGASNALETFELEIQPLIQSEGDGVFSFELMSLIEEMSNVNDGFESLYLQRDSIKLELIVNASHFEESEDAYVFSSQKAVSKDDVSLSYITIEKIYKPVVAFDEANKKLVWSDEEDKYEYTIQIDGIETAQQAVYNAQDSQYEFDLSSYFAERKTISLKLKKSADNYLDSDWSNEIQLYFLKPVTYLDIITDIEGNSYARFTYHDENIDKSRISVNVNGNSDITVSKDATFTSYEFALTSSVTNYVVYVVGYNTVDTDGNAKYFVSSASAQFSLQKLPEVATTNEISISNSTMSWNAYSVVDTPRYQIYFSKDGSVGARVVVESTSIDLNNATLLAMESGEYEVSVYAVNRNFSINAGGSGYYGGTIISQGQVVKLAEVEELSVVFDESGTTIANEKAKTTSITWNWDGICNDSANVKFEVYLGSAIAPYAQVNYVAGQTSYSCNLSASDVSEYNNTIRVVVTSDKDIKSAVTQKPLFRFSAPTLNITDEKVLTISYTANTTSGETLVAEKFIIRVSVNGSLVTEFVSTETTVDLTRALEGYEGTYNIEALIKGVSNKAVWSIREATLTGTLLESPEITQTSSGVSLTSGDSDVNYYITVSRNGETIIENAVVSNGIFDFSNDMTNGTYVVTAIAKKTGTLTSNVSTKEISISRLEEVTTINVQRSRTQNATGFVTNYQISWNSIANAKSYIVSIYSASGELVYALTNATTTINLTDEFLFSIISEAGNYFLGISAIGEINEGHTNSQEARRNIVIESPVQEFTILNSGNISWQGKGNYYLYATDGTNKVQKLFTEDEAKLISGETYEYSLHVPIVQGLVTGTIVKVGTTEDLQNNSETFYFDSNRLSQPFTKLQGIQEILLNSENGNISITTLDTYVEDIKFVFSYTDTSGETNTFICTTMQKEGNVYSNNFAQIFDALGIDKEGTVNVSVYIAQNGKLRSDEKDFEFNYQNSVEGDYLARRGEDALHDYLIIPERNDIQIKQINLKIASTGSPEYLIVEASAKRGYFNVYDDGSQSFSATEDTSAITSDLVYAILVNDLEALYSSGLYTIQVSYIYTAASAEFGFKGWSEVYNYTKLPVTYDPVISGGKITWTLYSSNLNSNITGFYVKFTNESGYEEMIYINSGEIFEVTPNHLPNSLDRYQVSVITINKDNTFMLASNEAKRNEYIIKTENLVDTVKISNSGVLSMSLKRTGEDASYGTLTGEVISADTEILLEDMPYGYGRYYPVMNNNLQFSEGSGTFTAIILDGNLRYVRTRFITKNDTTYLINADTQVYSNYNVALEDFIDENYTSKFPYLSSLINVLSKTTFTYPFVYTISSLNQNLNKFDLTFKNTQTFEVKTITVDALNIIDRSTIDAARLETLIEGFDSSNAGYNDVSAFVQLLSVKSNFTGLACDKLLFDDIGNEGSRKGENIEAGIYDLYITYKGGTFTTYDFGASSAGKSSTIHSLNSSNVLICSACEIASSPSIVTYRELNEDGYTYSYFLKMSPTYSNGAMLTDYTLSMSYLEEMSEDRSYSSYSIRYMLEGDDYVWKFIAGATRFNLNTVIDGLETYVLIPLNGENGINGISGMKKDCVYTANIFANGNASRLNSKTEPIEISLLGFDSNIKLTSKGFEWNSFEREGRPYSTTIVYKLLNEALPRMTTVGAAQTTRTFLPSGEGMYEYIMFMTSGSINKYAVTVESEIYIIRNVFKLYSPQVNVSGEGLFSLQNNSNNDSGYITPIFKITNNISAQNTDTELYYLTSQNSYRPGTATLGEDAYKDTELSASFYNFVLEGSDVETFNITTEGNGMYKVMNFTGDMLYLSSKATNVSAVMLENVKNVKINNAGNVQWNAVTKANAGTHSAQFVDGQTVMTYKVIVEYYYETGSVDENGTAILTKDDKVDVYYTKLTELPSDYVRGADESKDYVYKVTILAFPCRDDASLNGATQDISLLMLTNPSYVEDTFYILTNSGTSFNFKRLNDVTNIAISDGKITWESEYTNLDNYEFTVRYQGVSSSGILAGTYENIGRQFTFTVDKSQEVLKSGEDYTISVFVTAKNTTDMMTSFISSAEGNVRILPKVNNSHISITNTIEDTISVDVYDLKQYFLDYEADVYKEIIVNYTINKAQSTLKGTFTLFYNSDASMSTQIEIRGQSGTTISGTPIVYLVSGETLELSFTVVTTTDNYLNSYTYDLVLERKGWGDLDAISYDKEANKFSWTYGNKTEYYLGAETTLYVNMACNNASKYTLPADTILSIISENSTSYQIWYDADGDGINDGNLERFYILKTNVKTRPIIVGAEDTLYFNIAIKYVESYVTGEIRVEDYTTKIYSNVTDFYFFPELSNVTVVEFRVQAREGEKNLATDWLVFDCPDVSASDAIKLSLFASGDGSSENPYVIENADQFKNMNLLGAKPSYLLSYEKQTQTIQRDATTGALRTTGEVISSRETSADSKYYFVLGKDIELESEGDFIIDEDFHSIFDGNGHKITFTSTSGVEIDHVASYRYVTGTDGFAEVTFNRYNSIFKRISSLGEVRNLNLELNYTYAVEGVETRTLYAGLSAINNGIVSGVNVTAMNVNISKTISPLLAISGIVGINGGTVTECSFATTDEVRISNTQSAEQTLLFGGIVGFNSGNNAVISLCEVKEGVDVRVRLENSNSGIVQCGGIAISNNSGSILLCGNKGSIASGNVLVINKGYSAGVVVYSNGGSIYDCYNSGSVTGTEGCIGGVFYYSSSTIGNLIGVGTLNTKNTISNYHIGAVFTGTKETTCYTRYTVDQVISATALTASKNLSTKITGTTMNIVVSGSVITITFSKSWRI